MSKKKVTLEEAKKILGTDKVFYNNSKFNLVDAGKYHSGITIVIPQEWNINKDRQPESPIRYKSVKELTDGMNVDFDGDSSILFGKYRLSQIGKPVFELTTPSKAKDVLVKVSWGGAFNGTRGQSDYYAKEVGATFFTRSASNGGGVGNDYWILPVDFVKGMKSRNVSEILEKVEQKENERISQIEEYIKNEDIQIKNSIENRDRILRNIKPIIQNIQTINSTFMYDAQDEIFSYREKEGWTLKTKRYTEELVSELTSLLTKEQNQKMQKDIYLPMYKEMESTLKALDIPASYFNYENYGYSQEGYNTFINDITQYQEKIRKQQEESRRKANELRKEAEIKIKKEVAREQGYPEEFEFFNRLSGATNLSHAYVLESDGTIREPDYNNLININHKRKYSDWKNEADGTQGYSQILPGEIIVTYTKDFQAVPYIFDVKWADSEITEAQLEVICDILEEKVTFAEDINEKEITDIRKWATETVRTKAIECRKKLKIQEQSQEELLLTEIVELAEEKAKVTNKKEQARQLASEYEEQLAIITNQQSLGD